MSGSTLTAIGADLFRISLAQYGDPLAWCDIAGENGLDDYLVSGQVTLVLPSVTVSGGLGLPPQS